MKIALLCLVLPLMGCRESYCEKTCDQVRPQLIRDFAVLPSQIVCTDQKFAAIDDCQACGQLFEHEFGVRLIPGTCASDGGPSFVEPK